MDVQAHIQHLCKQIVEKFHPQKVILFGSYAYGTPTPHSDIDLMVVMPFEGSVFNQAARIRLELHSEMPMDLLVRTPEQVRQRIDMEDFFMRRIVEKGKVLYEAADA